MTPTGDWQKLAACKGQPQSLWFDSDYEAAKRVCQPCPVRRECYKYATENRIEYGCWGGLSPRERGIRNSEIEYRALVCEVCARPFNWAETKGYGPPKTCSSRCRKLLQSRSAIAHRDLRAAG